MTAWLEEQVPPSPAAPSGLPRLADLAPPAAPGTVVELGAGVCGLAALAVAALGYRALATDLPAVVPSLADNIDRNRAAVAAAAGASSSSACTAAPLSWGDAPAAADLAGSCRAAGQPIRLILGADIVYHEHLVDPLLTTLLALTQPPPDGSPPPPVFLTYVQRFKRAKAFFHKATKAFDVVRLPMGDVVDYDCLSWVLPALMRTPAAAAGSAAADTVVVDVSWAAYGTFESAVLRHDAAGTLAAAWASRPGACTDAVDGADARAAAPPPAAAVHHGVDTDSDTDKTFHDLFGATAAEALFTAPRAGDASAEAAAAPGAPHARAHAAALAAGIPFAEPLQAAGYLLLRRPAGAPRKPRTK